MPKFAQKASEAKASASKKEEGKSSHTEREAITHVSMTLSDKPAQPKTIQQLKDESRELKEKLLESVSSASSNIIPIQKSNKAPSSEPLIVIEQFQKDLDKTDIQGKEHPSAPPDSSLETKTSLDGAVQQGIYPNLPSSGGVPLHLMTADELMGGSGNSSTVNTSTDFTELANKTVGETVQFLLRETSIDKDKEEDEEEESCVYGKYQNDMATIPHLFGMLQKQFLSEEQYAILKKIEQVVPHSHFNQLLAVNADLLPSAYIDSLIEHAHQAFRSSTLEPQWIEALLVERLKGALDMSSRTNMSYAQQLDDLVKRVSMTLQSSLEKISGHTHMIADHARDFIQGTNGMMSMVSKIKNGLEQPGGFTIPDGSRNQLRRWTFKYGTTKIEMWRVDETWKCERSGGEHLLSDGEKRLIKLFWDNHLLLGPCMESIDLTGVEFPENTKMEDIIVELSAMRYKK